MPELKPSDPDRVIIISLPVVFLTVMGSIVMFLVGIVVVDRIVFIASPTPHPPAMAAEGDAGHPRLDEEAALVIGYAQAHPDPAIGGEFAAKLRSGEIVIVVVEPKDAAATFGLVGGRYVLTIDPKYVKAKPTQDEFEDMLSILSHEHAHYQQHLEGVMAAYYRRGDRPMSEAQCTLTILVEIDAHSKACRDAFAYGWTSGGALGDCARTPASSAEHFLRTRGSLLPECVSVWEFFAGRNQPAHGAFRKTRSKSAPKTRSSPLYLPPP